MEEFFHFFLKAVGQTTIPEWMAIVSALLYVILAARENPWCWLFGIISSAIYVWFNFTLRLYIDAGLSLYYCLIGIYGWYYWIRGGNNKKEAPVLQAPAKTILLSLAVGAAVSVLLGWLSQEFTDSPVPYSDATLSAFSLVATWMTARKFLENWIFWVLIDAGYVWLYVNRSAPMTAMLFLIYVIIAGWAYFKWRKRCRTSNA
ncbi:MAG: nicotinamide mononucleotide transporter [Bacteroidetes bacterium]|nr:MAG: nicotinamide mononucleotide transporter [Bacteroidota bacterium]